MNTFLQENNIEYKFVGIYSDIYKFELNDVSIHCTAYENKKKYYSSYYKIIIYVPQEIYEIKYNFTTIALYFHLRLFYLGSLKKRRVHKGTLVPYYIV